MQFLSLPSWSAALNPPPLKGSWWSLKKDAGPHTGEIICLSPQAAKLPGTWGRPSRVFPSRGAPGWRQPHVKTQRINSCLPHGHAYPWEGTHPLSWHADVCEVMPPPHLGFSPRLFLLPPCCIQRSHTSPLPSIQLGTPDTRTTTDCDLVGYAWRFRFPQDFSQSCWPLMVIQMVWSHTEGKKDVTWAWGSLFSVPLKHRISCLWRTALSQNKFSENVNYAVDNY